jgi:hypothetical protein
MEYDDEETVTRRKSLVVVVVVVVLHYLCHVEVVVCTDALEGTRPMSWGENSSWIPTWPFVLTW